jgi:hypothetical protein
VQPEGSPAGGDPEMRLKGDFACYWLRMHDDACNTVHGACRTALAMSDSTAVPVENGAADTAVHAELPAWAASMSHLPPTVLAYATHNEDATAVTAENGAADMAIHAELPAWAASTAHLPPTVLAYATHNEDAHVEMELLETLAAAKGRTGAPGASGAGLRVLYVSGCGTHAIAMASSPHVASIDAVDMAPAQARSHPALAHTLTLPCHTQAQALRARSKRCPRLALHTS